LVDPLVEMVASTCCSSRDPAKLNTGKFRKQISAMLAIHRIDKSTRDAYPAYTAFQDRCSGCTAYRLARL
jgi:hypothetical protein